jgi:hypothetical protein
MSVLSAGLEGTCFWATIGGKVEGGDMQSIETTLPDWLVARLFNSEEGRGSKPSFADSLTATVKALSGIGIGIGLELREGLGEAPLD